MVHNIRSIRGWDEIIIENQNKKFYGFGQDLSNKLLVEYIWTILIGGP